MNARGLARWAMVGIGMAGTILFTAQAVSGNDSQDEIREQTLRRIEQIKNSQKLAEAPKDDPKPTTSFGADKFDTVVNEAVSRYPFYHLGDAELYIDGTGGPASAGFPPTAYKGFDWFIGDLKQALADPNHKAYLEQFAPSKLLKEFCPYTLELLRAYDVNFANDDKRRKQMAEHLIEELNLWMLRRAVEAHEPKGFSQRIVCLRQQLEKKYCDTLGQKLRLNLADRQKVNQVLLVFFQAKLLNPGQLDILISSTPTILKFGTLKTLEGLLRPLNVPMSHLLEEEVDQTKEAFSRNDYTYTTLKKNLLNIFYGRKYGTEQESYLGRESYLAIPPAYLFSSLQQSWGGSISVASPEILYFDNQRSFDVKLRGYLGDINGLEIATGFEFGNARRNFVKSSSELLDRVQWVINAFSSENAAVYSPINEGLRDLAEIAKHQGREKFLEAFRNLVSSGGAPITIENVSMLLDTVYQDTYMVAAGAIDAAMRLRPSIGIGYQVYERYGTAASLGMSASWLHPFHGRSGPGFKLGLSAQALQRSMPAITVDLPGLPTFVAAPAINRTSLYLGGALTLEDAVPSICIGDCNCEEASDYSGSASYEYEQKIKIRHWQWQLGVETRTKIGGDSVMPWKLFLNRRLSDYPNLIILNLSGGNRSDKSDFISIGVKFNINL